IVGYLSALTLAVAMSPSSTAQAHCLGHTMSMLGFCVSVLVLVRGGLIRGGLISPLGYRLAIFGMLQLSYFELRELLPIVSPGSMDAQLSWIDLKVLHFEPSLFMDRLITPTTTEWFAFFYFSYFALLAVHVVPMVFFGRRAPLLTEFGLGMIITY